MQGVVDTLMVWLPDADPGTVQAMAAVFALAVTVWLAKLNRRSVEATERSVAREEVLETRSRQPCVVLDHDGSNEHPTFVIANIGSGPALNAFLISDPSHEGGQFSFKALGSLRPGMRAEVPASLVRLLQMQSPTTIGSEAVFIAAEPVFGGDWQLTTNLVRHERRIGHAVRPWRPSASQQHKMLVETPREALYRELSEPIDDFPAPDQP